MPPPDEALPLRAGRFRTTFDFGYASLQILGVYPEDGGEYTCRAVNRAGQATCKSALTCRGQYTPPQALQFTVAVCSPPLDDDT